MAIPDEWTSETVDSIVSELFNDPESVNTSKMTWDGTPEGAVKAKIWITNDGRVIAISEMQTSHLQNVIRWIFRNRADQLEKSYYVGVLANLRNELSIRKLKA